MPIEVKGFDRAMKHLDRIKTEMGTRGNLYTDISSIVSNSIESNFNAGGRDPRWPKREKEYSWPILDKTGTMKDKSIMSASNGWSHSATKHDLNVSSTEYAKYHQDITDGGPPLRKFVKLLRSEITKITSRIKRIFK